MTDRKIYQIGFNKCGTTSLDYYFNSNGIRSVHYDNGGLGRAMLRNLDRNKPLFSSYRRFQAYTDMDCRLEHVGMNLFKLIYLEDPDGVFILNIRPFNDMLLSKQTHRSGLYVEETKSLLKLHSNNELYKYWEIEYYSHIACVLEFFKDKGNFIFFDMSIHDGEYLTNAFNNFGFEFDKTHWTCQHKTPEKSYIESAKVISDIIR